MTQNNYRKIEKNKNKTNFYDIHNFLITYHSQPYICMYLHACMLTYIFCILHKDKNNNNNNKFIKYESKEIKKTNTVAHSTTNEKNNRKYCTNKNEELKAKKKREKK